MRMCKFSKHRYQHLHVATNSLYDRAQGHVLMGSSRWSIRKFISEVSAKWHLGASDCLDVRRARSLSCNMLTHFHADHAWTLAHDDPPLCVFAIMNVYMEFAIMSVCSEFAIMSVGTTLSLQIRNNSILITATSCSAAISAAESGKSPIGNMETNSTIS